MHQKVHHIARRLAAALNPPERAALRPVAARRPARVPPLPQVVNHRVHGGAGAGPHRCRPQSAVLSLRARRPPRRKARRADSDPCAMSLFCFLPPGDVATNHQKLVASVLWKRAA